MFISKKDLRKAIRQIPDLEKLEFECFKKNNKEINDSWMLGFLLGYIAELKNYYTSSLDD